MDEEKTTDQFFSNLIQRLLPFDFAQGKEGLMRVILLLVGIVLVVGGIFTLWPKGPSDEIKILSSENQTSSLTSQVKIKVDVSGAVLNPGVYELPTDARVEAALKAAGGATSEADQDWLAKNLNLAQKLTDGAKIYIPKTGESPVALGGQIAGSYTQSKININTASLSELDKLASVGPVTAQKIIDSRPYQTTEELRTKKVVGEATYQKIKDQITVY